MENLYKTMRKYGITTEDMCDAFSNIPKIPFNKTDIELIRNNPSLNWIQKRKLIKKIKKKN